MLNPDFRDMLSALSEENADFLLVGAYANAVRVERALARFGAPGSAIRRDDLLTPAVVIQIGVEPRRIDLLTSIDGVDFDDAWEHRVDVEVDGLRVPVIGRRHLILNEKTVGRPQDLADVARLEAAAPPSG